MLMGNVLVHFKIPFFKEMSIIAEKLFPVMTLSVLIKGNPRCKQKQ